MKKFAWLLAFLVALTFMSGCGGGGNSPVDLYPNNPYGFGLGIFTDGSNPDKGAIGTVDRASRLMDTIRPFSDSIFVYTCSPLQNSTQSQPSLARQKGFVDIKGEAWISGDIVANAREIGYLKAEIAKENVDVAVVGSEVMFRNDLTSEQLQAYIRDVKTAGKPVAFCDTADQILAHPEIVTEVQVVMFNKYISWEGKSIDVAFTELVATYNEIKAKYPDKEIIVGETGWPSAGNTFNQAVPSPENQLKYLEQVLMWSNINHIKIYWFEAFDEPYKAIREGELGAHWGLWTKDEVMKPGVLEVFKKTPVSIVPVDPVIPVINTGDSFFMEGDTAKIVKIPVDLSQATTNTVTVEFTTNDLTAIAGVDYAAVSGTLTFPAGNTSQTIDIEIEGDSVVEPDETLRISFSQPNNATLFKDSIVLTIRNDDQAVVIPTISIADKVFTEGNAIATVKVPVTLSQASTQTVTVSYSTETILAVNNADYFLPDGVLTFSPGTVTQNISFDIRGDYYQEPDDTFRIILSQPQNATFARSEAVITLVNDDPPISLVVDSCPAINTGTNIKGHCYGVDPSSFRIVVYIKVNGGWWIKPYFDSPLTPIKTDSSWECDITTGGVDQTATDVVVYQIVSGYTPPTNLAQLDQSKVYLSVPIDRTNMPVFPVTVFR
jgi:exo-beta-1,3-glucanase (GH17 family)